MHPTATPEAWRAARLELLAAEKAFNRERDALGAARRALPWVRIEKPYVFATETGAASLPDLFSGNRQLIVYHFMFGSDWQEGCPSCSFWADNFQGIGIHLAHRDTALIAVSKAPVDKLLAYRTRMGWTFPWVSSAANTFNEDFNVTFPEGAEGAGGAENGLPTVKAGVAGTCYRPPPGASFVDENDVIEKID